MTSPVSKRLASPFAKLAWRTLREDLLVKLNAHGAETVLSALSEVMDEEAQRIRSRPTGLPFVAEAFEKCAGIVATAAERASEEGV